MSGNTISTKVSGDHFEIFVSCAPDSDIISTPVELFAAPAGKSAVIDSTSIACSPLTQAEVSEDWNYFYLSDWAVGETIAAPTAALHTFWSDFGTTWLRGVGEGNAPVATQFFRNLTAAAPLTGLVGFNRGGAYEQNRRGPRTLPGGRLALSISRTTSGPVEPPGTTGNAFLHIIGHFETSPPGLVARTRTVAPTAPSLGPAYIRTLESEHDWQVSVLGELYTPVIGFPASVGGVARTLDQALVFQSSFLVDLPDGFAAYLGGSLSGPGIILVDGDIVGEIWQSFGTNNVQMLKDEGLVLSTTPVFPEGASVALWATGRKYTPDTELQVGNVVA